MKSFLRCVALILGAIVVTMLLPDLYSKYKDVMEGQRRFDTNLSNVNTPPANYTPPVEDRVAPIRVDSPKPAPTVAAAVPVVPVPVRETGFSPSCVVPDVGPFRPCMKDGQTYLSPDGRNMVHYGLTKPAPAQKTYAKSYGTLIIE